ncbi:hypothetical protein CUZ56_00586 [Saezia sanguinis]|uniref:DUF262 domain-containing protein n=1 Tax=Saezia sanguinis TaxID=1965230 RepID=A0A433SH75_9BURK|nr:DUF262 domain-containing protein [Saezia sanguinis]RUS68101.1 hypothetical protein CUZ56_00586 [Saezia sanguinis]
MKGEAKSFLKFLDGSDKRFIIPIYQRNYSWQIKQCQQLYEDLKKLIVEPKKPHFFGSIVSSNMENGNREDYLIIDGQQRLTTISLLLIAIVNLLKNNQLQVDDEKLCEKITKRHLVDEFNTDTRKVRLKPVNEDRQAFDALFQDESDFIKTSNVTANYLFFENTLLEESINLEKMYDAISRLEIIDIFLEKNDDPQLIFESLNSTGLALEEGDKIRNYILMNLPLQIQEEYYENYWYKIEKKTEFENSYHVSDFIKDYLTLKLGRTIVIRDIYFSFKEFAHDLDKKELLIDLLHYATFYEMLLNPKGRTGLFEENILRLNQLNFTVTYPFLLAVLERQSKNELSIQQVKTVFLAVETYIFRRLIVGLASNALNKVFATLDKDISKRQTGNEDYSEICKFILLSKEQGTRFPNNDEFIDLLMTKNIYSMSPAYKQYLFSRLENGESKEQINVIERLQKGEYSIEHVMPQTLNKTWKKELGENYEEIHNRLLHTLPNLTLTAYNSKYSNNSFHEKLTIENGFGESNLRLNKYISRCTKWAEQELEERKSLLEKEAIKLWPYPESNYVSPQQEISTYTLADDFDFKGNVLYSYEFLDGEKPVNSWKDMMQDVVSALISLYPVKMQQLASQNEYISEKKLSKSYAELGNYFIYANCNTSAKIGGLQHFFKHCEIDPEILIFNILTKTSVNNEIE